MYEQKAGTYIQTGPVTPPDPSRVGSIDDVIRQQNAVADRLAGTVDALSELLIPILLELPDPSVMAKSGPEAPKPAMCDIAARIDSNTFGVQQNTARIEALIRKLSIR